MPLARFFQCDQGIFAQGHHLLFAIESIAPAPELTAGRRNEQTEAAAIGEFGTTCRLVSRFRFL
jgi:hypothetical protein